ncbi:hypothetical protein PBN151_0407 [Paenibacillus sp. NAIST15-1]|nr:hypothetical protein PBN151_0407 [Paenibacillus sp. NAIST15-1]
MSQKNYKLYRNELTRYKMYLNLKVVQGYKMYQNYDFRTSFSIIVSPPYDGQLKINRLRFLK